MSVKRRTARGLYCMSHHAPGNCQISAVTPRFFSVLCPLRHKDSQTDKEEREAPPAKKDHGVLSHKLLEMTEDALLEGGRSARRSVEQAGFSEDLKKRLEERIAAGTFRSDFAAAHSITNMPSAGQGTRDNAAASPWTGEERLEDVTLRMLDSSKKPMHVPYKIPQPRPVDFRLSAKSSKSRGVRIAGAKETISSYMLSQSPGLSDAERESMRQQMRDRFSPGARSMPALASGLTSLANERIENAMARGLFDKIKRGKGVNVQADPNASSPYIDTTEYFMNKIIQNQQVIPPWIEKQQELKREVDIFRQRLRADWRRHAARVISSKGGSLEEQVKRAKGYAAAEARAVSQTKAEAALCDGKESQPSVEEHTREQGPQVDSEDEEIPYLPPLRDPQYLAIDRSYHELAVKNINSLTRSYNLQAPQVAARPYMNLDRELAACFADVAPSLPGEVRRRATEVAISRTPAVAAKLSTVVDPLRASRTARVYDEDKSKGYGFKEFFNSLFSRK